MTVGSGTRAADSRGVEVPGVLLEFLGRATVAVCATRDARLVPRVRYACGWRAEPDGRVLRVMIQEAHCAGLTESLAENGELAVTIEEIGPHEAYQFKGTVLEAQPCSEGDLAFVAQVRERFVQAISRIFAIPDDAIRAYFQWPGVALRMQVREIFVQTPGPGAGRRLVPPEERP